MRDQAEGMDAVQILRDAGGLAPTHELLAHGVGPGHLYELSHSNVIERVRKGWYALPTLPPPALQAARVGGRLTALSGAALLQMSHPRLWVATSSRVHVALPRNAARPRTHQDHRVRAVEQPDPMLCLHWTDKPGGSRLVAHAAQLASDALRCESLETAATLIESLLHTGLLTTQEWNAVRNSLPRSISRHLAPLHGMHESGTETLVALRMRKVGVELRPQVYVPSVGRVDFIGEDRVVIEVDGFAYHSDPAKFESDRRRDARLAALGYTVLRFSYHQVMERWHEVESAILRALANID